MGNVLGKVMQIRICEDELMKKMFLEDCCEILDSQRVPITAANRAEGSYPYYGANGVQDYVDDYIFDDELVLLAEDGGNFGSKTKPIAYRVSGKCWVNNHAHVLKPKNGLDVDFLCYSLMFYNTDGLVNGATRQKLTQATMRKMLIPDLSKELQLEIVNQLNRIVAIKNLRLKEIQKLDNLVKARFVELFGDVVLNDKHWETQEFSKVTDSRLGKMLDAKRQTGQSSFPYLANANVQWFRFEVDCLNEMDFNEAEQKEFALEEGDLLVCEGGEIGRCAIWHNQVQPCFFQKALHRVRCKQGTILPDYLAWWFKFNCENNGFTAIEGAKATIAHLPGAKLKKLRVVIPPLSLQNQFADFVTQVDKSKAAVQKALDETQLLFDSLMQEYFG